MTASNTAFLYVSIFLSTTVLMYLSQRGYSFKKFWFFCSFFIHWFFLVFTNIGTDYSAYYSIIANSSPSKVNLVSEPGFEILCLLLKAISNNPHICIWMLKTITIIIFYFALYYLRDDISLWVSVWAFNSILYLQGFYLLSEQIAIAVLTISFIMLIKNRNILSIIMLIVSSSLHTMCILLIPIYVMYFVLGKNRKLSLFKKITMIVACLIVDIGFATIYTTLINGFSVFSKYSYYSLNNSGSGIGLFTIFTFGVLGYFIRVYSKKCCIDSINNQAFTFYISALLFAALSYKVAVLLRINSAFWGLYSVTVPLYLKLRETDQLDGDGFVFNYRSDMFIWFMFISIRGVITLQTYMTSISSEINSWVFFSPF